MTSSFIKFSNNAMMCKAMFKPRLESILKEVVILSEVAELAAEANRLGAPDIEEPYAISSSLKINIPFADLAWACDRRIEPIGTGDDLTVSSDSLDDKLLDDLENKATQCLENSSRKQHVKDLLEKVRFILILIAVITN
jgi:hypothetical protein